MRRLTVLPAVLAAACVTESVSVCINCGILGVTDLRGGFVVVLTATTGATGECDVLQADMSRPIQWDGCLSPQGGTADSLRGVIRLSFVDSTGTEGSIEFLQVEGTADSLTAMWRTSCLKRAVPGDCPVGAGTARWARAPATP